MTVALGVGGPGPRAPRRLRATPIDSTSARLTWVDDSTDELGFEIQVRLFGEVWERAALVGADVEAFDLVTAAAAAGYANKKGSICGHVDTEPF